MKNLLLEIACFDSTHVKQITDVGAHRIELCSDVHADGISPSSAEIGFARAHTHLPLFVMIRPRGGSFVFSDAEVELMKHDISVAKNLGANGVVFGLLDKNGNIDLKNTTLLVECAKPLDVTFHRAFDVCAQPFKALEDLIALGIKRVLTSGQKATALEGKILLKNLITHANGRIEILAGGGVNAKNINDLADAGIRNFHASAHKWVSGKMVCDEKKIKLLLKTLGT